MHPHGQTLDFAARYVGCFSVCKYPRREAVTPGSNNNNKKSEALKATESFWNLNGVGKNLEEV